MNTLFRLVANVLGACVAVAFVLFMAFSIGACIVTSHGVGAVVGVLLDIVASLGAVTLGAECATDAAFHGHVALIIARHRYMRWRRRLQQLGGGSTTLAFNPYRDAVRSIVAARAFGTNSFGPL